MLSRLSRAVLSNSVDRSSKIDCTTSTNDGESDTLKGKEGQGENNLGFLIDRLVSWCSFGSHLSLHEISLGVAAKCAGRVPLVMDTVTAGVPNCDHIHAR